MQCVQPVAVQVHELRGEVGRLYAMGADVTPSILETYAIGAPSHGAGHGAGSTARPATATATATGSSMGGLAPATRSADTGQGLAGTTTLLIA